MWVLDWLSSVLTYDKPKISAREPERREPEKKDLPYDPPSPPQPPPEEPPTPPPERR